MCRYPPPARFRSRVGRSALRGRCRRYRGESRARSSLRSADGPSFALRCSCACALSSVFCFLARTFISLSRLALSASLVAVFLSIFAPPPYFVRLISGDGFFVCVALSLEERRLRHPSGAFGQVKFCGRWDSATTGFARQREMAQRAKRRPWSFTAAILLQSPQN